MARNRRRRGVSSEAEPCTTSSQSTKELSWIGVGKLSAGAEVGDRGLEVRDDG